MLSIQERSAAIRYSVTSYGSDGAEPETIGPFYDLSEAEARAESLADDGIDAHIESESLIDFVMNEYETATLNDAFIQRKIARIRQLGRRDTSMVGFINEARRIGKAYGQRCGLVATNWEPFTGLDNRTRQQFGSGPDADMVADLAELYAEVSFWRARVTAVAMRRADKPAEFRVLTA